MKVLTTIDLLALPSLETPPAGHVGFGAKSDGLYQKVGTVESKLSTTAELLDRVKTAVPANAKFTDTTYGVATTSANGLMSSADKSKLNGIEAGANNYSLPTASASVLGGIKVGSRLTISSGVLSANVQSDNNFTNAYKTKLDGIATGANNYVHPSSHPISFITGLQSALDLKALGGATVDFTSTASLNNTLNGLVSGSVGSPISGSSVVGFWTTLESNKNYGGGFFTRLGRAFTLTKENGVIQSWQELAYLTSNVASATKLQTARTINGTSFNGTANITTANWGTARNIGIVNSDGTGTAVTTSVNGSANVNLKLPSTIKATLTGNASSATKLQTARTIAGVSFDGTANIAIPFANLSSKPTTLSGYGITDAVTLNTAQTITGVKTFTGNVTAPTFIGALSGNASSATKLQTARTINGTSFNGSANITTARWGTARTLTVGNTGKSVNGSGNVSWSLSEIGALPITGGTMTGILKAQNNTSYATKQVRNIILSTDDANAASMANGDIWIKYV